MSVLPTNLPSSLVFLGFALIFTGCSKKDATATPTPQALQDAGTTGMVHDAGAGDDDVAPVYAVDPNAPVLPLAEKLCSALTEMPEKKRAACCQTTPGIVVTSECTRTLSAALRDKSVILTETSVDACIAAFDKTLDGCDWVGPFAPGPPAECRGILNGTLADGQRCRSSLECGGSLRCKGVGPTTRGKCGPAKEVGELCGGTIDTLATFVRQNDLDTQHPECASGHCIKHRCAGAVEEEGTCQVSHDCADGLECLPSPAGATATSVKNARPQRKCQRRELPKAGEACIGGLCADGLPCIANKCTARKPAGETCTVDFECRGGCLKSNGSPKGVCGSRCDIR
jgi:hypothetical protein